jgi:hypothetical protein
MVLKPKETAFPNVSAIMTFLNKPIANIYIPLEKLDGISGKNK